MTYFQREATNYATQFQTIADAYNVAGVTPPTRALDIKRLINDESRNVFQTAANLANEALLTNEDPEVWYQDAVEQIKEAQAREALAAAFNRSYSDAVTRALPRYLEDAAKDLTPAADRAVKQLVTAAKELPAGPDALDPEAVISHDAGSALSKARTSLAILGRFASVYQASSPGDVPPALNHLLPILNLPEAVKEQVAKSFGETIKTLNEGKLAGTRAIRKLATDAKHDVDLALVNVARGTYPGITLKLATPDEYTKRRATATAAHQRDHIAQD